VFAFWVSRAAYERWMRDEHHRIAALAESENHYSSLEVRVVDGPNDLPRIAEV
jgi:hypothetical protein